MRVESLFIFLVNGKCFKFLFFRSCFFFLFLSEILILFGGSVAVSFFQYEMMTFTKSPVCDSVFLIFFFFFFSCSFVSQTIYERTVGYCRVENSTPLPAYRRGDPQLNKSHTQLDLYTAAWRFVGRASNKPEPEKQQPNSVNSSFLLFFY